MGTTETSVAEARDYSAPSPDAQALITWAAEQVAGMVDLDDYSPRDVFQAILGNAELPMTEKGGSMRGIIEQVLGAPTLEDALQPSEAEATKDLLNTHIEIINVKWLPSDYEGGSTCFALIRAVELNTGIVRTFSTGSGQVMLGLWRAQVENRLPLQCQLVQSARKTRAGFYPFNIRAI